MMGTVTAPALSAEALTVSNGQFRLLVADPAHVDTPLMAFVLGEEWGQESIACVGPASPRLMGDSSQGVPLG